MRPSWLRRFGRPSHQNSRCTGVEQIDRRPVADQRRWGAHMGDHDFQTSERVGDRDDKCAANARLQSRAPQTGNAALCGRLHPIWATGTSWPKARASRSGSPWWDGARASDIRLSTPVGAVTSLRCPTHSGAGPRARRPPRTHVVCATPRSCRWPGSVGLLVELRRRTSSTPGSSSSVVTRPAASRCPWTSSVTPTAGPPPTPRVAAWCVVVVGRHERCPAPEDQSSSSRASPTSSSSALSSSERSSSRSTATRWKC